LGNEESEVVFHGSPSISWDEQRHGPLTDEDGFTGDAVLLKERAVVGG
jgi:hypothetical protein